jgi:hypothetical protein
MYMVNTCVDESLGGTPHRLFRREDAGAVHIYRVPGKPSVLKNDCLQPVKA